ncbi:DUF4363 family protein [Clostridium sp. MSJ-11]|uniref:DUF4363 family protein n=1 Tax=Clostridium mobile TaxID=2841512 RepID=A0ABS6EMP0_9CLOT|nr:DUF4363 family protein [Clostridium mobile]MBU5485906.1 DUF4363 family protein [Clostridium mobile]
MRKFFEKAIPVVILIFFILIMLSGNYLKRPLGKNDNLPLIIETTIDQVNHENWKQVDESINLLDDAWRRIVKRVQYSSERDEINSLGASLARLKGAVMAQDKSSALMELNEAYEHWRNLGK